MNVTELYNLTLWVEKEVTGKKVHKRYRNLSDILNQNSQNSAPKQRRICKVGRIAF